MKTCSSRKGIPGAKFLGRELAFEEVDALEYTRLCLPTPLKCALLTLKHGHDLFRLLEDNQSIALRTFAQLIYGEIRSGCMGMDQQRLSSGSEP